MTTVNPKSTSIYRCREHPTYPVTRNGADCAKCASVEQERKAAQRIRAATTRLSRVDKQDNAEQWSR